MQLHAWYFCLVNWKTLHNFFSRIHSYWKKLNSCLIVIFLISHQCNHWWNFCLFNSLTIFVCEFWFFYFWTSFLDWIATYFRTKFSIPVISVWILKSGKITSLFLGKLCLNIRDFHYSLWPQYCPQSLLLDNFLLWFSCLSGNGSTD